MDAITAHHFAPIHGQGRNMLGGTFTRAFAERPAGQLNTGDILCNAAQMERVLRREIARADRGGRGFSLVLFRVRGGERNQTTRILADVLLKRARLTDEVGWFSENYLAAILTGTPADGARTFADGVCVAVAYHAPRPLAVVYTYPSAEAFPLINSEANDEEAMSATRAASGNGRGGAARANGHQILHGERASVGTAVLSATNKPKMANGKSQHVRSEVLMDFLQQGFQTELEEPGLPARPLQELLTYPMPRWKRFLDIVGAICALIAFSPVMLLAAIAVRLSSPGPIIFTQKRSGLGGKPFTMFKFRTMVNGAEAKRNELKGASEQDGPAFKLTNDPRLTKIGKILRKTSVDELPQLFNVLKGDMSIVGPRPLPCSESEGCLPWQRHRMNVTPGLTCIWQVKGRSRVTFDEWVRMDMAYIKRRALWKDLQIIFATVPAVLLRRGAK
jgi:lipopolysaccharide/colanic/teichoic acid biosynthesis glycosyltransferase